MGDLYSNPPYNLKTDEAIKAANDSAKGYINSIRGNVGTNNAAISKPSPRSPDQRRGEV